MIVRVCMRISSSECVHMCDRCVYLRKNMIKQPTVLIIAPIKNNTVVLSAKRRKTDANKLPTITLVM